MERACSLLLNEKPYIVYNVGAAFSLLPFDGRELHCREPIICNGMVSYGVRVRMNNCDINIFVTSATSLSLPIIRLWFQVYFTENKF